MRIQFGENNSEGMEFFVFKIDRLMAFFFKYLL